MVLLAITKAESLKESVGFHSYSIPNATETGYFGTALGGISRFPCHERKGCFSKKIKINLSSSIMIYRNLEPETFGPIFPP